MATWKRELLAKVLLVAIFISAGLFLVAGSAVLSAVAHRNGVYEDGRFVEARVLKVVPGRPGEARIEYSVDGQRYQRWIDCGTPCPEESDLFKVEYSAKDPGRVTQDRTGPPATIALVGLFGTAVAIPTFALMLRRVVRTMIKTWNSTRAADGASPA